MALKLAIVRVNDSTGKVDKVFLESDVVDVVANALAALEQRAFRKSTFGRVASQEARNAFAMAEERLREQTSAIT